MQTFFLRCEPCRASPCFLLSKKGGESIDGRNVIGCRRASQAIRLGRVSGRVSGHQYGVTSGLTGLIESSSPRGDQQRRIATFMTGTASVTSARAGSGAREQTRLA